MLADEDKELCNLFGIWQLKKFMGKEYMGVVRSTFIIDPDGKVAAGLVKSESESPCCRGERKVGIITGVKG